MRMMQLYILGPAFGLPSIDPECNAAIALLQQYVRNRFEIITTHQDTLRLPLLVDGTARLFGFNNIVRHLNDKRIADEHTKIDAKQRADAVAITAFIEAHAQLLLDVSLYVSFENYRHCTRPAFTKILPWHANYIIPPQRRDAARSRTEHLGVHSIDVDDVHEDLSNKPPGFESIGKEQQFAEAVQTRASLLLPRKDTLMGLLKRPEHSAVFRLHTIADNFFGPLQDIIQHSSHLLGTDEPTAVDCLLFGYLSLALYPRLPQNWLSATMRRKYKNLAAYTDRLFRDFGVSTNTNNVMQIRKQTPANVAKLQQSLALGLQWCPPKTSSLSERFDDTARAIMEHLPLLSSSSRLSLWYAPSPAFWDQVLPTMLMVTTATLGAIISLAFNRGWLIWPHGEAVHILGRKRLSDLGDLGDALASIARRTTLPTT